MSRFYHVLHFSIVWLCKPFHPPLAGAYVSVLCVPRIWYRSLTEAPHQPYIHPTSTLHPPHIHPSSTLHPPDIDLIWTLNRPHLSLTSIPHRPHINISSAPVKMKSHAAYWDITSPFHSIRGNRTWKRGQRYGYYHGYRHNVILITLLWLWRHHHNLITMQTGRVRRNRLCMSVPVNDSSLDRNNSRFYILLVWGSGGLEIL